VTNLTSVTSNGA